MITYLIVYLVSLLAFKMSVDYGVYWDASGVTALSDKNFRHKMYLYGLVPFVNTILGAIGVFWVFVSIIFLKRKL